jgi:hypothetical protein
VLDSRKDVWEVNMADKWEYDVVNLPLGISDVIALLKDKGAQGWEIVTIIHQPLEDRTKKSNYFAYLKKQVVS